MTCHSSFRRVLRLRRVGYQLLVVLAVLIAGSDQVTAQTHYRILPPDFNADKKEQMMRAYLCTHVCAALDDRLKELERALASPEKIGEYPATAA